MHADRLARLRTSLAASQLDALLVSALPNVRYLTGFSGSNGLVLVTADAKLFDRAPLAGVAEVIEIPRKVSVWTDDFNNLLEALRGAWESHNPA